MTDKKKQRKVIHIEEGYKNFCDKIEREGPFRNVAHHEVFMMAMVLGFVKGKRKEIKKRAPGGFFREDTFTDEERAIILSIVISETNDLSMLKKDNIDFRYTIAEEYANEGFSILKEKLALPGTFHKKLESELRKKLKDFEKV